MERLTKKINKYSCSQRGCCEDLYDELSRIEDLMEKYEINSIEALEEKMKRLKEKTNDNK